MTKINENIFFILRIIFYIIFFYIYLKFMRHYSPLGVDWLDWHFHRLNNVVQHLKINGYFSYYGFSIWSQIENCALDIQCIKNNIYLTHLFFSKLFYIIVNEIFSGNNFQIYGQIIDRTIIFFTAILLSEILINHYKKKHSKVELFLIGCLCYVFFISNPWTYKMLIASWDVIFFSFFFLLGFYLLLKNNKKIGILTIFISGFFEYQLSAGVAAYYFLLLITLLIFKDKKNSRDFFPFKFQNANVFFSYNMLIVFLLLLPLITHFILQFFFLKNIDFINPSGSSLISRIGISGDDTHNGGILGAFQFLTGNRLTICFENDFQNFINNIENDARNSLNIRVYNCLLSHLGIFVLSVTSIFGLLKFFKTYSFIKIIIYPIIFLILSNAFILQQSSSVHLMGYSYLFSIIFSVGLTNLIFNLWQKSNSKFMIVFLIPAFLGIIFLCMRVSMLTGINS